MNLKNKFSSPVNGKPIITSPYGWRVLNGEKNFHDGIDFVSADAKILNRLNPSGTDVFAITDGKVVFDYDKYDDQFRMDMKGHKQDTAGNMVILQHTIDDRVYFARYLHLLDNAVTMGQQIAKGQRIGRYADVGFSFGPHLHFDMFKADWSVKVDPTEILFDVDIPVVKA